MRIPTLLTSLALAGAALAFVPAGDAAMSTCTIATDPACGGWVCADQNGDRAWSDSECVDKRDLDRCQFQSDCCSGFTGFWCPDRE